MQQTQLVGCRVDLAEGMARLVVWIVELGLHRRKIVEVLLEIEAGGAEGAAW